MVKYRTWPRWRVTPLGQKRANTGCTKTTATVLSETEIPWKITHPDIIQTQCCLTSAFVCFAGFVSLELSIKLFINYLKYRSDWSHSTNLFHWTNAIEHGEVVELKHEWNQCLSRINDLIGSRMRLSIVSLISATSISAPNRATGPILYSVLRP
jgi:hypothetical protein